MAFNGDLLVCAPLECGTREEMLASMELAKKQGADIVELCMGLMPSSDIFEVESLLRLRSLPSIVSFRYIFISGSCVIFGCSEW
ncbi:3-dehydroquinate dehydratase [Handroanthus impetiginosus]|uniref:3-dehydroquinate dehydratase n=1 Tax=Handroanthus impetiginosus TaxID=429701 RepID=A0A2G9I8I1_9LAMI|nr:3-dehydroquinate dehydratase [Handroanthus impetiginosus]